MHRLATVAAVAVTAAVLAAPTPALAALAAGSFADTVNAECRSSTAQLLSVARQYVSAARAFIKKQTPATVHRFGRVLLRLASAEAALHGRLARLHPPSADRAEFDHYLSLLDAQVKETRAGGRLYVKYRSGAVPTIKSDAGDAASAAAKAAGYTVCAGG